MQGAKVKDNCLFDRCVPFAAKNRPESSSSTMFKCMKMLREPFLIAKNDVA